MTSPRAASTSGRLGLGYWAGDEFVIVGAQLVNLSQDGVLAIAERAIPNDQRTWLRLDEATTVKTSGATVLGATWLRHGRCALRLVLDEDCPAGIYEALVACLSRRSVAGGPGPLDLRPRPGLSERWRADAGEGDRGRAATCPTPASDCPPARPFRSGESGKFSVVDRL